MINRFYKFLLIFFVFIGSNNIYSQFVNNSFEEWENTIFLNPTGWTTLNIFVEAVTPSSDAQEGSYSAKMEIMEYFSERFEPTLQNNGFGNLVDNRVTKMSFYYKSDFKNFARLEAYITTWDSNTTTQQITPSGSADIEITNSTSNWTLAELPIEYFSTEDMPAYINIVFAVSDSADNNDLSAVGSYVLIDNIILDYVTDVEQNDGIPVQYSLKQNYPNPFNPTTKIEYSIADPSFVQLKLYDILGNEVKVLVNENQGRGNYFYNLDASNLTSGTYIMQLTAGKFMQSKKILLLK